MKDTIQKKFLSPALIGAIAALALSSAGSTLYLPAMIDIAKEINTTDGIMQITLACYLITCGLSQLAYGPFSDAFGRRKTLLIGIAIFAIGSIISASATSISWFFLGRLIEGVGMGSGITISFSIMKDLYNGQDLSKMLGVLNLFVGMTPVIAPIIGGFLVEYIGWTSCFWFLTLLSFMLSIFVYFKMPETNKYKDPKAWNFDGVCKTYLKLLKSPIFVGFILTTSFAYCGLLTLNATLPFLMVNDLGLSPSQYGFITIITGGGFLIGALLSSKIAAKIGRLKTIFLGVFLQVIVSILAFIIGFEEMTLLNIIIPLGLILCGSGLILPTSTAASMEPFPEIAGSEAAMLGTVMYSSPAIFLIIASFLPKNNQLATLIFICCIALLVLGCALIVAKYSAKDQKE